MPFDLNGVKVIYSNSAVFVAVKEDGTVVAWGKASRGGSVPQGLSGVNTIYSTYYAFAALKDDGTVEAWGYYMGNDGGSSVPLGLAA